MSEQQECQGNPMVLTTAVSGLFAVGFLIGAILTAINAPAENLFLVSFSLDAILFTSATVSMLMKKQNLGTGIMIAGGILSLPVGVIPMIFGVIARKKLVVRDEPPKGGNAMNTTKLSQAKKIIAMLGCVILIVGGATPVMKVLGDIHFFAQSGVGGLIVPILGLVSFGLIRRRKYQGLWLTGLASWILIGETITRFQEQLSKTDDAIQAKRALGYMVFGIDVEFLWWGWTILLVGASMVLIAAGIETYQRNRY